MLPIRVTLQEDNLIAFPCLRAERPKSQLNSNTILLFCIFYSKLRVSCYQKQWKCIRKPYWLFSLAYMIILPNPEQVTYSVLLHGFEWKLYLAKLRVHDMAFFVTKIMLYKVIPDYSNFVYSHFILLSNSDALCSRFVLKLYFNTLTLNFREVRESCFLARFKTNWALYVTFNNNDIHHVSQFLVLATAKCRMFTFFTSVFILW